MGKLAVFIASSVLLLVLAGCASGQGEEPTPASLASSAEASAPASSVDDAAPSAASTEAEVSTPASAEADGALSAASEAAAGASVKATSSTNAAHTLVVSSGDARLEAALEENAATAELIALLQDGPIAVDLHEYGGFEMLGNLPQGLPTADEQMSTTTGDIVLYQGNQISFFYGSNNWSYTRLGHIAGYDSAALLEALGGPGNSTVELSLQE